MLKKHRASIQNLAPRELSVEELRLASGGAEPVCEEPSQRACSSTAGSDQAPMCDVDYD